ncbi:MAG: DUF5916 domain-containing protein, partial [Fidelibacterota bacterium]
MDKIQKTSEKFILYWVILNLLWSQDQIDPVQIRTQGVNHNKIAYVTRIDDPPTIDGILSEEAWNLATPINDFVQEFPNNLTLPSERTEVRLLFDDYALYVGVHLFDSSPKDISERLARRDDWMAGFEGKSDWFTIDLDSRHDHQTSFVFGINASGVQIDATVFDDFDYDEEWNAVWYSEISKDITGWHIEIEIPFAILRYSESDTMTWGMDMARYIHRKNEHITWVPRPRGVRGIASRYGNLVGFDHVPAAKQIEFLPYFLTGRNKNTGENLTSPDFHPNEYTTIDQVSNKMEGGVDIKYGISSNAALDLTINPDFGWVEADPAVINLTYYESYFSEKRPFFMENSTLFETPIEMFYSRRIGKMDSRILTAGKLTGKSENGFSYGVLGAIESDNQGGSWSEGLVDDGLSYNLASRVVQDILMGNSFIVVMLTLSGKENYLASTISTDQLLTFDNNRLTLDQQIAMSDVNGLRGIGYSGELIYD